MSATIHSQDFLRADTRSCAAKHWARLHNSLPHAVNNLTPARLIGPSFHIDATHQYRHAFGDLLCFPLQGHERLWKFDVKNDIGFYLGNEDRIKGGNLVYLPYTHSVLTRGNSHRILISDQQLLQWYSRHRDIRQSPLPYCVVQTAILYLLADRATPRATTTLVTPQTDPNDNITLPQQRTRRRNDNRTCATHPHQRHSTTPCDSHQLPQHTAPPERNNPYRTTSPP